MILTIYRCSGCPTTHFYTVTLTWDIQLSQEANITNVWLNTWNCILRFPLLIMLNMTSLMVTLDFYILYIYSVYGFPYTLYAFIQRNSHNMDLTFTKSWFMPRRNWSSSWSSMSANKLKTLFFLLSLSPVYSTYLYVVTTTSNMMMDMMTFARFIVELVHSNMVD